MKKETNKCKKIEKIVEKILEKDTQSRKDDMILYFKVCQEINPNSISLNFKQLAYCRKELKLPNYETISRCRRKILNEKRTELRDETITSLRESEIPVYKEYSHT